MKRKMKMASEDWVALAILIFGAVALFYNSIWLVALAFFLMFGLSHSTMAKGMGPWVIVFDVMFAALLAAGFALVVFVRHLF